MMSDILPTCLMIQTCTCTVKPGEMLNTSSSFVLLAMKHWFATKPKIFMEKSPFSTYSIVFANPQDPYYIIKLMFLDTCLPIHTKEKVSECGLMNNQATCKLCE